MNGCQGCGAPLSQTHQGRPRKWCSERCRKDTLYSGRCAVCGTHTNGYNGPGTAALRCAEHRDNEAGARALQAKCAPRRERFVEMWAAGLSLREIAAEFGWTVGYVSCEIGRMRQQGWDLPHRYSLERRERAYERRWAA